MDRDLSWMTEDDWRRVKSWLGYSKVGRSNNCPWEKTLSLNAICWKCYQWFPLPELNPKSPNRGPECPCDILDWDYVARVVKKELLWYQQREGVSRCQSV